MLKINNNDNTHNNNNTYNKNLKNVKSIEFFSATLGGFLSSFISSPLELCMIQQQLHGKSMYVTLNNIIINHNLYTLCMRGYISCALRDSIYVTGMLGVTPLMQCYFIDNYKLDVSLVSIVNTFN